MPISEIEAVLSAFLQLEDTNLNVNNLWSFAYTEKELCSNSLKEVKEENKSISVAMIKKNINLVNWIQEISIKARDETIKTFKQEIWSNDKELMHQTKVNLSLSKLWK